MPVGGVERLRVRVADAGDDVPVVSGPAEAERRSRRDDVEPPTAVEVVGEWQEIGFVGATAVVEEEEPRRLLGCRPLAVCECRHYAFGFG